MASLYRKSKILEFDDSESITVIELEVSVLMLAERGELELTDEVLIKECTGLNKSDLNMESYTLVLSTIDALHRDVFEEGKEKAQSKKN